MDERLTEVNFTKHLDTVFRVKVSAPQPVELKLVEVKGYSGGANEQSGMERFSLYFNGPGDLQLPQRTYELEHEQLGSLDIFLVTIARDEQGFRYEAVFNYFKESQ
ncbi:MAG: hypothetical protein ND895_02275 [Pyrinomonadaceae bacterium]|nr:hypothetical protein [Pyrinomonadaceae bacterium]